MTVVEGKKLVRDDVLRTSGLLDSEVLDTANDGLLLSSTKVQSLLCAVNRLQSVSAAYYRFGAVERSRSVQVKRKSSGFLAELGERTKSANGGLSSPIASSPNRAAAGTASPAGLVSPPRAVAASPPSQPQQPVYSYPPVPPPPSMPSMPPSLPPSPLPPPSPMPAAGLLPSEPVPVPSGFRPPPLPPPPMPPPMPPPPPPPAVAVTHQPSDAAPVAMSVDRDERTDMDDGHERRPQREWKKDEYDSDSKSSTRSSRRWEAETNGREDRYGQHDDRRDRGDRPALPPQIVNALPQPPPHREVATEHSDTRERERDRDRGRDDRERKGDRGTWQPHERRWSGTEERRMSDDRWTWRDERDERDSHHQQYDDRGDDRLGRWSRDDRGRHWTGERDWDRDDRHDRRDGSRDSDRDSKRDRRDETKTERHQPVTEPVQRSTSTSKSAGQRERDGTETERSGGRIREAERVNGVHGAAKRYDNGERERDDNGNNGHRWDRHSSDRRDNDRDEWRTWGEPQHDTADRSEATATIQPRSTATPSRPTQQSTSQQLSSTESMNEEKKGDDRSAERWRQPADGSIAGSDVKQSTTFIAPHSTVKPVSTAAASPPSAPSAQPYNSTRPSAVVVSLSQRPRSEAERSANKGSGQPSSDQKRPSVGEPKAALSSVPVLRIGFS